MGWSVGKWGRPGGIGGVSVGKGGVAVGTGVVGTGVVGTDGSVGTGRLVGKVSKGGGTSKEVSEGTMCIALPLKFLGEKGCRVP